ncbi:MAG: DNA polymerase III subunit [Bacteroidales bacterium]|nr:DNA polymerase III subunit [Bacteroidales bacterium]MDT8432828.1 DNA polymerase III subunit [Bacteroidales bacterium]
MQFKEVFGQEQAKARLIKSVKDQRISHAQLFFGLPGTGKLPLAIAYAQYICCTAPKEDDSCGVCPSCVKFAKLAHPDLHFVFPVVNLKQAGSKPVSDDFIARWREAVIAHPYISEHQWYEVMGAENKQGFISRSESSAVLRKLSLKSYESEFKVLVVWLAEKMNASAANSLLKLLEEPPQKTIFLLVSENTDLILPTILSRTQMIRIPPLDPQSIREGLQQRYPGKEEIVQDVIRRSNGNYSTAVQLMESDELDNAHFEEFVFLMRKCYMREIIEIQKWTERIAGWGRERLKMFLTYGLRLIRENFMLNLQHEEITFMSRKESEFSQKFSAFIHQGNVFGMAHEFERAIDHIEANGQAKIVLLDLAIKNILLLKQIQ